MKTTSKKIFKQIEELLAACNYTPTLPVIIYGERKELNEAQVRALQVIARQKAEQSKRAFNSFNRNIYLYMEDGNGFRMMNNCFLPTGRLATVFQTGFYDVCARLSITLSRAERTGKLELPKK